MVLKRYTPPTCTLEVTAKSSPLSRWAGKPVLKSLSFELRLDDPRLPDIKHVTLKGDRQQLEALHEAVNSYIQNFLCQSRVWEASLNSEASHSVSEADSPPTVRNALTLDTAVNPYEIRTSAPNTSDLPVHPYLEPRGILAHNLFLGSLRVAESGPVVPLSTVQLFDLVTALDEYSSEVMALPNLSRSPRPLATPWLKVAAMVVASVGLTTGVIKMLQVGRSAQTASAPTSPAASPPQQQNLALGGLSQSSFSNTNAPSTNPLSHTNTTAPTAPAHQHHPIPQSQLAPPPQLCNSCD